MIMRITLFSSITEEFVYNISDLCQNPTFVSVSVVVSILIYNRVSVYM